MKTKNFKPIKDIETSNYISTGTGTTGTGTTGTGTTGTGTTGTGMSYNINSAVNNGQVYKLKI